mgnify:CR=1 FL=1
MYNTHENLWRQGEIKVVENDGEKYAIPAWDVFSHPHQFSTYKPVISEILKHCNNKRVVFQAGGNIGIYTKEYSNFFDTVYTAEPDSTNFKCLSINCIDNLNIVKFQTCLGSDNSSTHMLNPFEIVDCGGIHVYTDEHKKRPDLCYKQSHHKIPIIKIDNLCIDNLDLIHLDIEGYELYALQGAIETIKKYKPTIVLEICEHSSRFGYTEDDLHGFLSELGYEYICTLSNNDKVFKFKVE